MRLKDSMGDSGGQPVGRWSKISKQAVVCVALVLAGGLVPVFPQVRDIILPVKLPAFITPIPSVPLNESLIHIPITVSRPAGDQRLTLEATLYRPPGPGPFPLVVLSHGTARDPSQRLGERLRYNAQSWEFVSLGFAVVIPMRRGFANSEGDYAEEEGFCDRALFYEAGMESAKDLRATLQYMYPQPFIDPRRIVLAGHSSGGFASLALASQGFTGVVGVINIGGGRGSMKEKNC
jgi:hypothetical protein